MFGYVIETHVQIPIAERVRKWRERNPVLSKVRQRQYRKTWKQRHAPCGQNNRNAYLTKYGLTADCYERLLAHQDGKCGICQKPPTDRRRLAVDHDHETGTIRGLLCTRCNASLGSLGDSEAGLLTALRYIRRHKSFSLGAIRTERVTHEDYTSRGRD